MKIKAVHIIIAIVVIMAAWWWFSRSAAAQGGGSTGNLSRARIGDVTSPEHTYTRRVLI